MGDEQLTERRREAADAAYEDYDFTCQVVDASGWEHDNVSDEWTRPVFVEDDESPEADSVKGHFTVRFEPGSDVVAESWASVNGQTVGNSAPSRAAPR